MLERFWAKARIASIISLIFLTLGLVISPWSLVLVLIVVFCGPLIGKIQPIKQSFISKIKKNDWKKIALVLTLILLAFNQEGGGLGFLILALIPIGWAALTDRSIFKNNSKDTSTVGTGNTDQEKSITQVTELKGPLKGQELLAKVKELGDVSKSDLVKACGYVSQKEDGSESLKFTAFYEALLEAKGVGLKPLSTESDEETEDSAQIDLNEKIEKELIKLISENINNYGIKDFENIIDKSISKNKKFDFSRLEGSYDSTLYEWIHLFLKTNDLYKYLLNKKQLTQANAVPEGTIYGPNSEDDENYEEVQEQIDEIHWDSILVVAKEGIRQRLSIDGIEEYLENCGMDEYLDEINSIKVVDSNNDFSTQANQIDTWESLDDDEIIEKLKTEEEVPIEVFKTFINSENWEIRQAIALNEQTPAALLDALRMDDDNDVKDAVAYRELPKEWKSLDDDEKIEKLKEEDNVDLPIINILAKSNNCSLREAIAIHPSTPSEIIETLSNDNDDDVKDAVAFRELPKSWKSLDEYQKIEKLEEEENVDLVVINIFANSKNYSLREAIANHPSTPTKILELLSTDDYDDIKNAARKSLKRKGIFGKKEQLTSQRIYIKTEPAGKVIFGELNIDQIEKLKQSIALKTINDELLELKYNSDGTYKEYEGVFSYGDDGDKGNEGIIKLEDNTLIEVPKTNSETYKDGIYFCYLSLTKASIEFSFIPPDRIEYDLDELLEISVPVLLPEVFTEGHELYGNEIKDQFNVLVDFEYKGELLEEYDKELIDRGYDDLFRIVEYKNSNPKLLYSNYNGEEKWCRGNQDIERSEINTINKKKEKEIVIQTEIKLDNTLGLYKGTAKLDLPEIKVTRRTSNKDDLKREISRALSDIISEIIDKNIDV